MNIQASFHLLRNVDITCESHFDPIRNIFTPRPSIAESLFSVSWPDGTPCSFVEIFLAYKFRRGASIRADGGSLRAAVSKLMPLIRHCWKIKKDFWELEDDHIYSLIIELTSETKQNQPFIRARDNNTIRAIITTIVEFLLWLQDDIMCIPNLIGKGTKFRIRLKEGRTLDHRRKTYSTHLVYHSLPPPEIKEPKRPISRDKRNALWMSVSKMAANLVVLPSWAIGTKLSSFLSSYLKARRELLLELLEATGARPGELSQLSVLKNYNCDQTLELVLITLKRRRYTERKIKLQPAVAIRLKVFINKHRLLLLNFISASGTSPAPFDRVFLGINGEPCSERYFVSEFSRISKEAGLKDYQSCMSMFRHRFITKQIAIHLGIYTTAENKVRDMMTDSDYRTVLKKVATITGHGNELSLLHYLDLAWDELGVGNQLDIAIAFDSSIEMALTQVISLIGDLEHPNGRSTKTLLNSAKQTLTNMLSELRAPMKNIQPKT